MQSCRLSFASGARRSPLDRTQDILAIIDRALDDPSFAPVHVRRRDPFWGTAYQNRLLPDSDVGLQDHFIYSIPRDGRAPLKMRKIYIPPVTEGGTSVSRGFAELRRLTAEQGTHLPQGIPELSYIQISLGRHPKTQKSQDITMLLDTEKPDSPPFVHLNLTTRNPKGNGFVETAWGDNVFKRLSEPAQQDAARIVAKVMEQYRACINHEIETGIRPKRRVNKQELVNWVFNKIRRASSAKGPGAPSLFQSQYDTAYRLDIPGTANPTAASANKRFPETVLVAQKEVKGTTMWSIFAPQRDLSKLKQYREILIQETPTASKHPRLDILRIRTSRGREIDFPDDSLVRVSRGQWRALQSKIGRLP